MTPEDCIPVKNVYRVISHGSAKRVPRIERCPVPVTAKRTCPNRYAVLVEFDTKPRTGARYCEQHFEAAKCLAVPGNVLR